MNNASGLYSVCCLNSHGSNIYVKQVIAGHIDFVDEDTRAGLFDFETAANIRVDLILKGRLKGYRNPVGFINGRKRNQLLGVVSTKGKTE